MWMNKLTTVSWYTSIVGGVMLGVYQILHPQRDAASVLHSPYATIHAMGIVALFLLLLSVVGIFLELGDRLGKTSFSCFLCMFFGTALWGGMLFTDATINPLVATLAPHLQTEAHGSGAFHTYFPLFGLAGYLFLLGPLLFILGYAWFGTLIMRFRVLPWWIGFFFLAGGPLFGPAVFLPLPVETTGGIIIGCGFILVGTMCLINGRWKQVLARKAF